MDLVKLLQYVHAPLRSLAAETSSLATWAARAVLANVAAAVPWLSRRRRLWAVIAVVLGLAIQALLLWLLGEMISLCISLAELWTELAYKHLGIMLYTTS